MAVLVKNATLVTAEEERPADVRCRNGRIAEVGRDLEPATGEQLLDGTGQLLLPGGVDPHVHMALPVAGTVSADDFESGSAAALAGGTTSIIDFVHPERGQDLLEALRARREEARRAAADYGFHMAITTWGDSTAEQMRQCLAAGVPSFKIYLAYKDTVGLDDRDVVEVFAAAAAIEALVLVHAEHGDMVEHLRDRLAAAGHTEPRFHAESRPSWLEGEATHRAATLAGTTGAALYVVHVTCRESLVAIEQARVAGWEVRGETCPQYLLLDDRVYETDDFEGAAYVIAPPIRPVGHQDALWQAIVAGTLEVVATDHCPFTMAQKELGRDDFRKIPGGAAGVEHRLALLHSQGVVTGRIDRRRFVDLVSTRPAQIFGLYPRKGAVQVGSDADLVLWDPAATATISAATHHHRTDRSLYEGFEVTGAATTVLAGGRVAFADGELRAEPGAGTFLERHPRRTS